MRTRRHATHSWDDLGWPLLAGVVAATGLWADYRAFGLLFLAGVFAATALTITPVAVDVGAGLGKDWRRIVLVGVPACALALDVVIGLFAAFGVKAILVVVVVSATAPAVRAPMSTRARRAAEASRTRRQFDEIVAGLILDSTTPDGP